MKNTTNQLVQEMLDKANQVRIEEYEKIRHLIRRLTLIDIVTRSLLRQLEQDPAYRFGLALYEDHGPLEADDALPDDGDDVDPLAEDVPGFTPPQGCGSCPYRVFAPDQQ